MAFYTIIRGQCIGAIPSRLLIGVDESKRRRQSLSRMAISILESIELLSFSHQTGELARRFRLGRASSSLKVSFSSLLSEGGQQQNLNADVRDKNGSIGLFS
jgi:hypothetical protein